EYWVRHVRETVRFADAVRSLADQGVDTFLELGPDGSLCALAQLSVDAVAAVPVLRRGRGEERALVEGLARLHCAGVGVGWERWYDGTGARRVDLPTYAFQHERYWPALTPDAGDVTAAGLIADAHPMLGAVLPLAQSEGVVFASRLSIHAQPWLAGRTAPATGLLELALRVGDHVGCDRVEQLAHLAPLSLPVDGSIMVQVRVGEPDQAGARAVTFFSRADGGVWTEHATGILSPVTDRPVTDTVGADVEFALSGEVAREADRFGLHPALLAAVVREAAGEREWVPVSWRGVSLHAAGASVVRARIGRTAEDAVSLVLVDAEGAPVLTVEELFLGAPVLPVGAAPLREGLLCLEWVPAPVPAASAVDEAALTVLRVEGGETHEAVHEACVRVLGALQEWLAGEQPADARLVVVVPGDLAGAAVSGLVRAAESENPDRFLLVDIEHDGELPVAEVLAAGEPYVRVREGVVHVARLARLNSSLGVVESPLGGGTVLVTGGTG
ncbi:hypothetical protein ABZ667_44045, partial [Streptomyces lavendulae]